MGESIMITGTTPIWQLSVDEFKEVLASVHQPVVPDYTYASNKTYDFGIPGIMRTFKCSNTTAHRIKQSGVIDAAISQKGRKIVVEVEKAVELMRNHKEKEVPNV